MHCILEEPYATAFKKAAGTMKAWYDKGYINKDAFANNVLSSDSFAQGKSAVAFGNARHPGDAGQGRPAGFEVEIVPVLSKTGTYPADPFTNNAVAVAASTKNVAKTAPGPGPHHGGPAYNFLVYFGVEGKNYVIEGRQGRAAAGRRRPTRTPTRPTRPASGSPTRTSSSPWPPGRPPTSRSAAA